MLKPIADHPENGRNAEGGIAEGRKDGYGRPGPDLHQLRADIGLARRLRFAIRHAKQQTARDDAIVAYSRVLDRLVNRLIELEDDGYLTPDPTGPETQPR